MPSTPSETLRLQRELAAKGSRKPKLVSRAKVPFPHGFSAWISETNEMITGGSYSALRINFDKYIKQKKLRIPDPIAYLDDAICEGIRRIRGNSSGYCQAPIVGTPQYQLIQKYHSDPRGPKNLRRGQHGRDALAWKSLHLSSLDGKLDSTFLNDFTRQIGCGSCKAHWKTIMRQIPPDYSFDWTVKAHNAVSRRLSPPTKEFTTEEALSIWAAT
jgi:hypothetical protein